MSNNVFLIYQLKGGVDIGDYHFESSDTLRAAGLSVDKQKYNHIYTAPLTDKDTLDSIYVQFNINHPADFAGLSLSTSDIIVLRRDGESSAHYVEPVGFTDMPEFLDEPYRYYSTQRPFDIGTFPKTENGPISINNFDVRQWVENDTFRTWGYITYNAPLTQQQMKDYELRAASDNPDRIRLSPRQLEAQAQVVGKWEKSKQLSLGKRFTFWNSDFGVFVKENYISNERLSDRFAQVVSATKKQTIQEQLAQGAIQAAKDNAARPASIEHTDKDR